MRAVLYNITVTFVISSVYPMSTLLPLFLLGLCQDACGFLLRVHIDLVVLRLEC